MHQRKKIIAVRFDIGLIVAEYNRIARQRPRQPLDAQRTLDIAGPVADHLEARQFEVGLPVDGREWLTEYRHQRLQAAGDAQVAAANDAEALADVARHQNIAAGLEIEADAPQQQLAEGSEGRRE